MNSSTSLIPCVLAFAIGCTARADIGATGSAASNAATPSSSAATVSAKPSSGLTDTTKEDGMINMVPQTVPPPPDVANAPPGAQQTRSGMFTVMLKDAPDAAKPRLQDRVRVAYDGWSRNGVLIDSTSGTGPRLKPVSAPIVTKGWTEALQMMSVGQKRRFWMPAQLAYGQQESESGLPGGQLTFDIELLEIDRAPEPPPVPADVASPPPDAIRTSSGLTYRVLAKGDGKVTPNPEDDVEVNFTGWTSSGKLFDSSVPTRTPKRYTVGRLIPGWAEGLRMMVKGDRWLFWIPASLAHGDLKADDFSKKPRGDLVVDVELVSVSPRRRPGDSP